MASKSCNDFFSVKFRNVFKLFLHRVNASSNFATVTFFTVFKMCRHRVNAVLATKNVQFRLITSYFVLHNMFPGFTSFTCGWTWVCHPVF